MSEQAPLDGPYLDVEMPERFELQFLSERGEWMGEALCSASDFDRLDNGAYVYSGGGSGLWIRCVAHHADHFEHLDGGGQLHRYRLVERVHQPLEGASAPRLQPESQSSRWTVVLAG